MRLTGKDPHAGKDWRWEEKGTTEDEMVGRHHRLDGHESEQAPGVGDGQGGLASCSPWGHKESDTTEWLNWTQHKTDSVWQLCSVFCNNLKKRDTFFAFGLHIHRVYLDMDLFLFNLFEIHFNSWSCGWMSFINFLKISSLINKNITPALFSISSCSGVQTGRLINHFTLSYASQCLVYTFHLFFLSGLHSGYYHLDYLIHKFFFHLCQMCLFCF